MTTTEQTGAAVEPLSAEEIEEIAALMDDTDPDGLYTLTERRLLATIRADRERIARLEDHLRLWLYAPSGAAICTCSRTHAPCWYCQARSLLLEPQA